MNFKIFGFISLLILSTWYYFQDTSSVITVNHARVAAKTKSHAAKKIVLKKIPTHSAEERVDFEESVPWKELESKWELELNDFILSIDPSNGQKRFNQFQKKKKGFKEQTAILMKQREQTYSFDELTNEIMFKDKKKYEQINDQINTEHKLLMEHTHLIFGKYYQAVAQFHLEFETTMQAYNNTEGLIGVDPAFSTY